MSDDTTDETVVASTPSRRGRTLKVARVTIIFEDGSHEVWDMPPKQPGFYRQGGNRQTKPTASWTTHELWWQCDRMVEGVRQRAVVE